jgi:hypothetical protein
MESKKWYLSKTLWASIIGGAATLATVFGVDVGLTAEVQAEIVAGALAVVGIILRFKTTQPIGSG